MNNIICAIAKNEDAYINDWVKYHLNLGFNHIYVYDNNELGCESIVSKIDDVDRVTIIDARGEKTIGNYAFQSKCYDTFYKNYCNNFDWCAFIDVDEFITLRDWNSIEEFLNDDLFKNHVCIRLNMTCIGDDGMIERDMSIPVYEALKGRCDIDWLDFGGKQIVKGGMENITFGAHCPYQNNEIIKDQITPSGKIGQFGNRIDERNENAYIRHYRTKTLSEFVKQKLNRSDACAESSFTNLNYFFESNARTKEKEEWLRNKGIL